MYITQNQIIERSVHFGAVHHASTIDEQESNRTCELAAEDEIGLEHLEEAFRVHDQITAALSDDPEKDAIAWMLLKGMSEDDLECTDGINEFWFTQWTIREHGSQYKFDHNHRDYCFFDADLLRGLQSCEEQDKELDSLRAEYLRNLSHLDKIRFNRVVNCAFLKGVESGLYTGNKIIEESENMRVTK